MSDLDIYIIDYLQKDIKNNIKEAREFCKKYSDVNKTKITKKVLSNEIMNSLLEYVTKYNKMQNNKDFTKIENYVDKCLLFRQSNFQKQILDNND